ncbi:MAG TPA: SGNH/GDSL hydrolase family protein, partial [Oscillatoriaceae cyanobacterium]
ATKGSAPDTWAFFGDSVTANAFDPAVADTFSQVVATRHPGYAPIVISAGTGGDTSEDALGRLRVALPTLPTGCVIGLCYGSNDASHGVAPADYKAHLETAVDLIRAAGDQPVVAVVPWSLNGAIADYARACREVATEKGLPPGPDFYSFFQAHPDEQMADHVHPDAQGVVDMQRLWAEAADFRY